MKINTCSSFSISGKYNNHHGMCNAIFHELYDIIWVVKSLWWRMVSLTGLSSKIVIGLFLYIAFLKHIFEASEDWTWIPKSVRWVFGDVECDATKLGGRYCYWLESNNPDAMMSLAVEVYIPLPRYNMKHADIWAYFESLGRLRILNLGRDKKEWDSCSEEAQLSVIIQSH